MKQRSVTRFYHQAHGGAVIEFALVAPLFLILFMGVLEFCVALYLRGTMESTVHDVARFAITGGAQSSDPGAVSEQLRTAVENLLVGDNNEVSVRSFAYASISDLNAGMAQAVSGGGAGSQVNFGGRDQLMRYEVTYEYQFITPLSALIMLATGEDLQPSMNLTSTVFIKNENY